jgi:hypothetical protein
MDAAGMLRGIVIPIPESSNGIAPTSEVEWGERRPAENTVAGWLNV